MHQGFEIQASERVVIGVYDAAGRRVTGLADRGMRPGFHSVDWDGTNGRGEAVPSGVYFLRIDTGRKSSTSKVVVVR
jgi:flagellar hook assembly protein FlgD